LYARWLVVGRFRSSFRKALASQEPSRQEGIMKVRRSIAAAGAAVALGTTGALVLPAVASAHSASHTLKLTAVTNKSISFTRSTAANQETDLNSKGKTVGYDDVWFKIMGPRTATAWVAFDLKGGFLYAKASTTNGGKTFKGTVTGGTGAYKGATGTVTGKAGKHNKTAITIKYH
jgi:hypothetical protein